MAPQTRGMRIVAGTVGFLFFGTNCLFAYSTESNIWAERRKALEQRSSPMLLASLPVGVSASAISSRFPPPQKLGPSLSQTVARSVPKSFLKDHAGLLAALSPAYGTIRKVSIAPKSSRLSPVVIHIQDVHQNLDAQKNIGQMVGSLVNAHQADLIALEGTWGEIPLQPFRDFANRKAVELSADYLLKENKISGPIHAALIGTGPLPPLIGVDDPAHYTSNVEAYRQSAPRIEQVKKELDIQKAGIEQEKARVFSSELSALDHAVESYRSGRTGLGEYVHALTTLPLSVSPSIQTFQETLSLEKTLDFKQVESERATLINRLVQNLSRPEIDKLTAQSVAYRAGEVSYAEFYSFLQTLCARAGISLQSFPAMKQYIRYVLLADGINAETLLSDLMSLERQAYAFLAKTPEAMDLVKKSRANYLAEKLADFSLTPEEWKEYKTVSDGEKDLTSFESFYQEADSRDHAMAENVLKAIKGTKGSGVSIIVTGGFHSPGLTAHLTQAGATVISIVPKIDKLETTQGATYLSVFTQEKTPLDKLFAGEKLFLAQDPISRPTRQIVAPLLVALTGAILLHATGLADINTAYHSLEGLGALSHLAWSGVDTVGLSLALGGTIFNIKVSAGTNEKIADFSVSHEPPPDNIALAPVIGTGLALATTAFASGGIVLLGGSAVAGVVAPLVGAVFGGILMSHYLLPKSWLPKSHSRKDISFPKVLTMTILYATSITFTLWGIFGVETLGLNSAQIGTLFLFAWSLALLSHGFFDGWLVSIKQLVNYLSTSPKSTSPKVLPKVPKTKPLAPLFGTGLTLASTALKQFVDYLIESIYALRPYWKAIFGLSIPLVTVGLSYVFSGEISSSFLGFEGAANLSKIIMGAVALGLGSVIEQSIREVTEGRPIRFFETTLWVAGGAFFLGIIVFSIFYPLLDYFKLSPWDRIIVDLTLFTFFCDFPFNYGWRKVIGLRSLPSMEREEERKKFHWLDVLFPIFHPQKRPLFFFNYAAQVSFWGPVLYCAWGIWPYHAILIVANATLIWGIVTIFFVERMAGLVLHPSISVLPPQAEEKKSQYVRWGGWIFGGVALVFLAYALSGFPGFDVKQLLDIFGQGDGLVYVAFLGVAGSLPVSVKKSVYGSLSVIINLLNTGSFVRKGLSEEEMATEKGLKKAERFLPELEEMGVTEVYLTGGLFQLSLMGKKVHTYQGGNGYLVVGPVTVYFSNYTPKQVWIGGILLRDGFGNNYSTGDMRILNSDVFQAKTNEGRWAELKAFVEKAHSHGIKVKVDLVPWISPDGVILMKNPDWVKFHQQFLDAKKDLSDRQIFERHPGNNSLIEREEDGRPVRVLLGNAPNAIDQVDPDPDHPGYQAYLLDFIDQLVRAGVDSIRVDMAENVKSKNGSPAWGLFAKIIEWGTRLATEIPQTFTVLVESYNRWWQEEFLRQFPGQSVYDEGPRKCFEDIAAGRVHDIHELRRRMEEALSRKGQRTIFPETFDNPSLKNIGGPVVAFFSLLLSYAAMGDVPLMVHLREIMDQEGENIPQAGGQGLDAKGNREHPFPRVIVRGFHHFWRIFRSSPHRKLFMEMKSFFEDAESIEILDTPDQGRYFAVGVKTRDGNYKIRIDDFFPKRENPPYSLWVGVPKSFLNDPKVVLHPNENKEEWKQRVQNTFHLAGAPLNLVTVYDGDRRWVRLPVTLNPNHVARMEIQANEGTAVEAGRVNDITAVLPRIWKPLSLTLVVMTGLVSLGFPGVALQAGLLAGLFALAQQEHWKERFSFAFPNMNSLPMLSTPLLQKSDQGTDSPLVSVVDARPTNLGVEFMDGKARETVETALRHMGSVPLSLKSAWLTENGKGTPVLLVDDKSVETETQKKALTASIKDKPNAVIMTNAEDLTIPGVSPERIFYRPGAFSSLRTAEGLPLGLVSISLRSLLADLAQINHYGEGLTFLHTAVTELNTDGLGNDHMDIREAAKRAWILNALFQLVPARSLDWNKIKETLTAIARNA